MFDVFGMMWATMLLNIMTGLCTLTGMGGVCIKERIAMGIVRELNACMRINSVI